jgi:hypothetical protein
MRAINVLLCLVVSALIAVGVFEGGLRLLGKGPPPRLNLHDPAAGWVKAPNRTIVRSTPEYAITIRTNSAGLREEETLTKPKPASTYRVLALGDSFTLGYSVERADCFVEQLERWWRAEGRPVEVVNAGTEGYSTDQAVAWLERYGRDWSPDLVLLFPYDNDLYWNGQRQYMGGLDKPSFDAGGKLEPRELAEWPERTLLHRSALARLLGFGKPKDVASHVFTPPGGSHPVLKEFAFVLPDAGDPLRAPIFEQAATTGTAGALKAFQASCARLGARGVVVPIPSHSAVDPSYRDGFARHVLGLDPAQFRPERPVEVVLDLAKQAGLTGLDARQALASAAGPLYYEIDWHFTPLGNAAFAAFLHDELDRSGLLPASMAAKQPLSAQPAAPLVQAGFPFWAKLYLTLLAVLTVIYWGTYPKEAKWAPPLKIAALLGAVFGIVMGGKALIGLVPPQIGRWIGLAFVLGVLVFVAYKLGRRLGTIAELLKAFTLRGHWYLMPLVIVLLSVGSLLVVAASSPLVAPFIYTLF